MTFKITVSAMLLVAATVLVTSHAVSQEMPGSDQLPPEMQEGMKKWQEAMTPGEEHAFLRKRVGKWKQKVRFWMSGPGSEPMESEGTCEITSILGGRWLQEKSAGLMMGMPHEGFGLSGYDNFRKQFRSVWLDNMSTTIYELTGHLDKSGKVLTMYTQMDEPMTGEIAKMARFVTTIVSDDEFRMEGYDIALGDDAKVMEIVYTRVK
jgi:hypothetical protein